MGITREKGEAMIRFKYVSTVLSWFYILSTVLTFHARLGDLLLSTVQYSEREREREREVSTVLTLSTVLRGSRA